jgi:class 3 adenylate cyclase
VAVPPIRYAQNGDVSLAYQVVGDGPLDLVAVTGFVGHLELWWEEPAFVRFWERLASFSRLILWDKREQGLSDRLGSPPTLEQGMDDLRAVLDAAASERAALVGFSEGGPLSILFAATHPARTRALVLWGTYARITRAPDYPDGVPAEAFRAFLDATIAAWGGPAGIEMFAPSMAREPRFAAWWTRLLRSGTSPRGARALMEMYAELDVRHALPAVSAPTLVLQRSDDRLVPPAWSRLMAAQIADASYVELPGRDHLAAVGDPDPVLDEIEEFLTGRRPLPEPDRLLSTVLFTDIVGSTERATELGDRRWGELLETHDGLVRRQLERFEGREVKTMGDGFLATFDGPARGIKCAREVVAGARELGLEVRAGLHTGECEVKGDDLGGIAVHIGARVGALAGAGQVLVSGTVKDLVVGSGIEFDDRGSHSLKGVPGEWRLYAVAASG